MQQAEEHMPVSAPAVVEEPVEPWVEDPVALYTVVQELADLVVEAVLGVLVVGTPQEVPAWQVAGVF